MMKSKVDQCDECQQHATHIERELQTVTRASGSSINEVDIDLFEFHFYFTVGL